MLVSEQGVREKWSSFSSCHSVTSSESISFPGKSREQPGTALSPEWWLGKAASAGLVLLKPKKKYISRGGVRRGRGVTASHGCSPPEILPSATHQLWDLLGNATCLVFAKPWALGCPCILTPCRRRSADRSYFHFQQHRLVQLQGSKENPRVFGHQNWGKSVTQCFRKGAEGASWLPLCIAKCTFPGPALGTRLCARS